MNRKKCHTCESKQAKMKKEMENCQQINKNASEKDKKCHEKQNERKKFY